VRRTAFAILIAGAAAFVFAVAPAVAAVESGAKARLSPLNAKPSADALARYDANRDGTLDVAEKAAMRQDILQRMKPLRDAELKEYDWNRNGLLEDGERAAMTSDRQKRHEFVEKWALERYDADHNGVLDAAEQQARKAAREEWLQQKKGQILETFDANKNGMLDPEEKAVMRQKSDAARQAALDMYDSNRDGRLDDAERAMATGAGEASGARRTGRSQTPAGAGAGKKEEPGAAGGKAPVAGAEAAVAAGPPLSSLRVSPIGGRSFAEGAEIAFTLGREGAVTARVHDAAGRLVRTLASGERLDAGARVLRWDGRAGNGRAAANGLYLVTVEVNGSKATRKVAYIR
jgi:Ca2+-binding EF-hand superfamily protein